MTEAAIDSQSVIVERELPFPPERVWRALTQSHLMGEWLMPNDFLPVVGHQFSLRAGWDAVAGEVLEVAPTRSLSYTWGDHDLRSVVRWTLTPIAEGTRLRMEQTGFRTDQPRYVLGARSGWPRFLANLERALAGMG